MKTMREGEAMNDRMNEGTSAAMSLATSEGMIVGMTANRILGDDRVLA